MNTLIKYRYVDAGNYKTYVEVIIKGELTFEQVKPFLVNADNQFIPTSVGLPPAQRGHDTFPDPELDHVFNEFDAGEAAFELTEKQPTINVRADQLLKKFMREKAKDWPVVKAMERLGLW